MTTYVEWEWAWLANVSQFGLPILRFLQSYPPRGSTELIGQNWLFLLANGCLKEKHLAVGCDRSVLSHQVSNEVVALANLEKFMMVGKKSGDLYLLDQNDCASYPPHGP
ncbi:hypothetical protein N7519_007095 [Penicillium mononematosum]|uniref:uncharacterized protein n=1 Tax=Penicillium mononematosum TaxID=268346 RepID=UPI0025482118|nr:uncharacterized protein N7519_007095 [Penicillium mononematosum]KAJ6185794.1 hypothetical protein N7519_007095 [Penicillium mononematosum]